MRQDTSLNELLKDFGRKMVIDVYHGKKYTTHFWNHVLGYYKLEDGSIVVNSSSEQELSHSGDLRDKYNDFNPNDKFYYIKLAGSNEWAELLFNQDNS